MKKNYKNITNDEMKGIELNILEQFAGFCEAHNLHYSLCGGTLLGAVRHKGFIPWDDDIDVFVPRQSYNFLCKHFNKWGKIKNLKLINYFTRNYYSTFSKIIDTRTYAVEEKRSEKIGVWIDLFIVDSVESISMDLNKKILFYLKEMRYFGSEDYINGRRLFKRRIVRFFKKPILRSRIEKFIRKNKGPNHIAYSFADQINWWKDMKYIDFSNSETMMFEGKTFKVMGNWKNYLTLRYGKNYMTPPPASMRISHPLNKCYWIIKSCKK